MDEAFTRGTARRKAALVTEILQGKTTVSEASRAYDLAPSEIENGINDGKRGMENSLRAHGMDIREQCERQAVDHSHRTAFTEEAADSVLNNRATANSRAGGN